MKEFMDRIKKMEKELIVVRNHRAYLEGELAQIAALYDELQEQYAVQNSGLSASSPDNESGVKPSGSPTDGELSEPAAVDNGLSSSNPFVTE